MTAKVSAPLRRSADTSCADQKLAATDLFALIVTEHVVDDVPMQSPPHPANDALPLAVSATAARSR